MNLNWKNLSSAIRRALSLPSRIIMPVARFVHLGVTLNAQDDGFWVGVCYLMLTRAIIWLMQFHLDRGG